MPQELIEHPPVMFHIWRKFMQLWGQKAFGEDFGRQVREFYEEQAAKGERQSGAGLTALLRGLVEPPQATPVVVEQTPSAEVSAREFEGFNRFVGIEDIDTIPPERRATPMPLEDFVRYMGVTDETKIATLRRRLGDVVPEGLDAYYRNQLDRVIHFKHGDQQVVKDAHPEFDVDTHIAAWLQRELDVPDDAAHELVSVLSDTDQLISRTGRLLPEQWATLQTYDIEMRTQILNVLRSNGVNYVSDAFWIFASSYQATETNLAKPLGELMGVEGEPDWLLELSAMLYQHARQHSGEA